MRAYVPAYEMRTPKGLTDALSLLAQSPGEWRPFAGGTEIMVQFEAGKLAHRRFLNILKIPELKGIRLEGDAWVLGSLVTYGDIVRHPALSRDLPLMLEAARATGAIAIQNRGTLGGNVVNASPAADTPPALLVYGAEIELVSTRGERRLPYADFHIDYKKTQLAPDELVKAFRIPRLPPGWRQHYRKVGTRKAQALSKICLAGVANVENAKFLDLRLAIGAVAPIPLRLARTEAVVRGQTLTPALLKTALAALEAEIAPLDDIRSSARYRRTVARNLVSQWLGDAGGLSDLAGLPA